jgi:hypothetical protein
LEPITTQPHRAAVSLIVVIGLNQPFRDTPGLGKTSNQLTDLFGEVGMSRKDTNGLRLPHSMNGQSPDEVARCARHLEPRRLHARCEDLRQRH